MNERKLPPLGYECCDPRGGYEGCCGLFIKTKIDPPKPTPCGQCAHLSKAVESLERYVRIEQETADKMALRGLRAEGKLASLVAYVNQLRGDYKAGNEFSDGAIWAIGEVCSFLNKLDAQTSAQATRTDLVVAEGVTLPVGEKPATGELVDKLQEVAEWIEATGPSEHQTPWLIHRDVVREAMQRLSLKSHEDNDRCPNCGAFVAPDCTCPRLGDDGEDGVMY